MPAPSATFGPPTAGQSDDEKLLGVWREVTDDDIRAHLAAVRMQPIPRGFSPSENRRAVARLERLLKLRAERCLA